MTQDEMEHWLERLSHVSDRLGEIIALNKDALSQQEARLRTQAQTLARIERTLETILGHVQGRGNGQTP